MPSPLPSKTKTKAIMKRYYTIFLALLATIAAQAQAPFSIHSLQSIRLPQGLDNISTVDDRLFGYNHLLVSSPIEQNIPVVLQPDTQWASLIPSADYIVRNPSDSLLYFTSPDANGITQLYTLTPDRFRKTHRINIHGWQREICHPTFSPNGKMMIFTSKGKVGLGGYDLWCSLWNGHRWTRPINLGNTINTPGNETNPVFYLNYLIFTSDSIPNRQEGRHLYAFYMGEKSSIDEIIFNTYTIQPLPYPINSGGEDMNMAYHHPTQQGWWVSSRSGKRELYSFAGQLESTLLCGTVTDQYDRPLPQANVTITLDGRAIASTQSDNNGNYQLLVLPNNNYTLQASLSGYFHFEQTVPVTRTTEQLLINSQTHNIQLSSLPLGRPIMLQGIFNNNTDIEISPDGANTIKPIINFLRDNPQVTATIDIYCNQTTDESFNNILIQRRINTLQQFMRTYLPSESQFSFRNGNLREQITPSDSSANHIFITLNK